MHNPVPLSEASSEILFISWMVTPQTDHARELKVLEVVLLSYFFGERTSQAGLCWGQLADVTLGEIYLEVMCPPGLRVSCGGHQGLKAPVPRAGSGMVLLGRGLQRSVIYFSNV